MKCFLLNRHIHLEIQNVWIKYQRSDSRVAIVICGHCQDYIPEDSLFCPHCGLRPRSQTRARKGNRRFLEYVVIVLLLAVGIFATLFLARRAR